ncbi:GNAT family N-acetyltransferase [Gaopeijia maritima]|uniref:GNAT family N-acetyltransferase n=1 Tax=Gaopeijia maritima TaxID=3119007 RepID=A0ABU9E8M5_9BACT
MGAVDTVLASGHRLRLFRPSDREACLAVFDSNVPDFFGVHERREYVEFLGSLPGPYWVLEEGAGLIVGAGGYALVEDEGRADLCWGMVHGARHGEGLGRTLTEVRMDQALRHPRVREFRISTSQHTRGFYERLGFRVIETIPEGFGPGMDRCDMRWSDRNEGINQ